MRIKFRVIEYDPVAFFGGLLVLLGISLALLWGAALSIIGFIQSLVGPLTLNKVLTFLVIVWLSPLALVIPLAILQNRSMDRQEREERRARRGRENKQRAPKANRPGP